MFKSGPASADEIIFGRGPGFRRRVVYTMLLLVAFRILARIPVLHVDEDRMNHLLAENPLLGTIDLLAGGEVMKKFSVVAAGLVPYLMALGLAHVTAWIISRRRGLPAHDEKAKKQIEKYTGFLTIPLSIIFAFLLCRYLSRETGLFPGGLHWFTRQTFLPSLKIVTLVTIGSLISTAIVALITKKGVTEGRDVVLLAGSSFAFLTQLSTIARESANARMAIARLSVAIACALIIIVLSRYLLNGQRQVEIASPGAPSRANRKLSHLPLLLSCGRMQPVAVAIGCLAVLQLAQAPVQSFFGGRIVSFTNAATGWATPNSVWYWIALSGLIVFYTYVFNFYMLWHPFKDSETSLSEHLRRNGQFIPGVRPGHPTEEYLTRIMWSITPAAGLALVMLAAVFPYAILRLTGQNILVTLLSLIVVVGIVNKLFDVYRAREALTSYEGFLRSGKGLRARD